MQKSTLNCYFKTKLDIHMAKSCYFSNFSIQLSLKIDGILDKKKWKPLKEIRMSRVEK